ncbi:DUF1822 family protein [Cylindrospermum sp. FACHB-282]|uniref:DUF1822 family protein n=1 Tax=Cylindrospermum sp. FACHB-282 TaxID=2692794 RepID=UPI00168384D5|nr:DUF1822 family protein [Cylindrospermum sp. FACHB-282]MBD2386255.1 DUF1822 family protein [Cylindrospermum sp. FACHB-282]
MTVFTFANPTDLILEIPSITQNQAFSGAHSRYQAYINQLCLLAVLPWFQEELTPQVKVWPSTAALSSFWELVNGSALILDATRFVLVPSEDIDLGELRVPQEWVDIPGWAGDYYLGVQVEPDDGFVRVWGYCTHGQLKTQGSYDSSDRTYCLDASEMINDINVLTVGLQLCPDAATRNPIEQIPPLLQPQAQNLITRLGNPEIITPRLAIPGTLWLGLMAHGGWRQSLYQRRLGLPEQWSVMQWLQSGVSQVADTVGWGRLNWQQTAAGARSVSEVEIRHPLFRQIAIAGQLYEMLITPLAEPEAGVWRFELRHVTVGAVIPGGFKLRLLTEDLQPFPNNEAIATTAVDALFIEVALELGEGIVWEIEPLPENYDREILKF